MEPSCRICYEPDGQGNPLCQPCRCSGSLAYIHHSCLLRWIVQDGVLREQACHLCRHPYQIDLVQRLEKIPGPHEVWDFLLRTPLILLVAAHYSLAYILWITPPILRFSQIGRSIFFIHQFVHVSYCALFAAVASTNNVVNYIVLWNQQWYWIMLIHQVFLVLYKEGIQEAGYAADLWLAMYWHAHKSILKKLNERLLGDGIRR